MQRLAKNSVYFFQKRASELQATLVPIISPEELSEFRQDSGGWEPASMGEPTPALGAWCLEVRRTC